MRTHAGLGTRPPELLPEVGLMQTFLCLLGRGVVEGPGFKPGGLRVPAGQGLALGFRHTITTQACVHACLVCSSHSSPSPRSCRTLPHYTHLMLCTWRLLTSLTPGVGTHLPLTCCPSPTHPGTPNGSSLILSLYPGLEVPCPAGRVNMQWESRAVQWQVCVSWHAHSWGWPMPLCGPCCVKLCPDSVLSAFMHLHLALCTQPCPAAGARRDFSGRECK